MGRYQSASGSLPNGEYKSLTKSTKYSRRRQNKPGSSV